MSISYPVLGIIVGLGLLAFISIVILVVIWQSFATRQMGMSVEREETYQKLLEQVTEAQRITAQEQQKISTGIDELRTRIASIEKMLREVD
jgi:septal ring factor EnvC (AmiA/AmiB activator)